MPALVRCILAVIAGVLLGIVTVTITDMIVHRLYPLPPGVDPKDPAALATAIAAMPTMTFVLLALGWVLAAAVGAYTAARIATKSPMACGLAAMALLLLATLGNLKAIPHPTWMWGAAIVLMPLAGWAAARKASQRPAAGGTPAAAA
jgi:hypothetical protein